MDFKISVIQSLKRHYIRSAEADLSSYFIDMERNGSLRNTDPEFLKEVERLYIFQSCQMLSSSRPSSSTCAC